MSALRILIAGLVSSCFLPLASAKFMADPLTKGDLAVWCIFDFIYVLIALLCVIPILRLRSHRSPFIALLAATICAIVQCSVEIGYILTAQADQPGKVVALGSTIVFFGNWSSPLLYLSLWLILSDRSKHWQKRDARARGVLPATNVLLFRSFLALFAFLMLLATLASALYANQLSLSARLVELRRVTRHDIQIARDAAQTYLNASYTFSAFWFFSAICVAVLSAYVYRSAKRARVSDRISKIMLFVVTPLFILGMIESIVFTIYFSPSVTLTSEAEAEELTLASDLISNAIYAAISLVIAALGLKSGYWSHPEQVLPLANLGALPAGRYLELEDPPTNK